MYMYFFVSVLVKSCNEKWHHHCFKNVNFLGMNFHFYIVQRFFYTFSLSYWCILESFWEEILLSQRKWADAYFKVILNNKWSSNVHVSAYLYCQIEEKHRKWKYWSLLLKKKRQSNYIWYKSSSLNEINISEFAWVEISYYSLACYASNAMYSDKTYQNEMMLLWNSNKVAQNNLRLLSKMAALH